MRVGRGKAEEEGVGAKDQQGFVFFGPGERKEKGTGREELGGGDELLCLVCVLVCVV